MASGYEMRVGNAEREAAPAELPEHHTSGRLTLDELNGRTDKTFAAKASRAATRCGDPVHLAVRRGGSPRTAPPVTGRVQSPPYPAAAPASTTTKPKTSRQLRRPP